MKQNTVPHVTREPQKGDAISARKLCWFFAGTTAYKAGEKCEHASWPTAAAGHLVVGNGHSYKINPYCHPTTTGTLYHWLLNPKQVLGFDGKGFVSREYEAVKVQDVAENSADPRKQPETFRPRTSCNLPAQENLDQHSE